MVGLVFVSHIRELSKGVIALARLVGPDVPMEEAGGLEDGSAGTDMERIASAIENADQGKGVLIFMDLGSAVMSTEMALELNPNPAHIIGGCSICRKCCRCSRRSTRRCFCRGDSLSY